MSGLIKRFLDRSPSTKGKERFGFQTTISKSGMQVSGIGPKGRVGRAVAPISPEDMTTLTVVVSGAADGQALKALEHAWVAALSAHPDDSDALNAFFEAAISINGVDPRS